MLNTKIETVISEFKTLGKGNKNIIAIYIYGSILYLPEKAKDIDALVVLQDVVDSVSLMNSIYCQITKKLDGANIDLNFVFESEVNNNLCGQKSPFYYIYVRETGKLIYGANCLLGVIDSAKSCYRWTVLLSDRARHSYYNNIELDFWTKKFRKWLIYVLSEIHYLLSGKIESDLNKFAFDFVLRFPEFNQITQLLVEEDVSMKQYLEAFETLRFFIRRELL